MNGTNLETRSLPNNEHLFQKYYSGAARPADAYSVERNEHQLTANRLTTE